jgi:hypothetical protein
VTKRELIELVYLNLSAGKLSSDIQVERVDLAFYFPVAFNFAILQDFYERNNLARQERAEQGFASENKILGSLLTTFPVVPQEYVALPSSLMILPGGRGLDALFGKDLDSMFAIVGGPEDVVGLTAPGAGYAWLEGEKLYLKGCECTDCTLFLRMMSDGGTIGLDDQAKLPAGREDLVVNKMMEFYMKTRFLPQNIVNDNVDDAQKK